MMLISQKWAMNTLVNISGWKLRDPNTAGNRLLQGACLTDVSVGHPGLPTHQLLASVV